MANRDPVELRKILLSVGTAVEAFNAHTALAAEDDLRCNKLDGVGKPLRAQKILTEVQQIPGHMVSCVARRYPSPATGVKN